MFNKRYSEKIDCYAVGLIMYQLITGHSPFYANSSKMLEEKNSAGCISFRDRRWNIVSVEAKNLVMQLT